jgi:hypothetical protein
LSFILFFWPFCHNEVALFWSTVPMTYPASHVFLIHGTLFPGVKLPELKCSHSSYIKSLDLECVEFSSLSAEYHLLS